MGCSGLWRDVVLVGCRGLWYVVDGRKDGAGLGSVGEGLWRVTVGCGGMCRAVKGCG